MRGDARGGVSFNSIAHHCERVLNERVAQAIAVATRSQPPKPVSLRDAGFAGPCGTLWGGAGMWLLPCPRSAL